MVFVLASNNPNKKNELLRILRPLLPSVSIVTAKEAGFTPVEPEETGTTFAENARIKAQAFMELTGMPAIADDSGLCVDALDGAPGIHSARYGGDHDPGSAIPMLLRELDGIPAERRGAHFACHICCLWPDGRSVDAYGRCDGFIGLERGGDGGFGFDPVFYLPDGRCFGAIAPQEKDAISHRGRALSLFAEKLAQMS